MSQNSEIPTPVSPGDATFGRRAVAGILLIGLVAAAFGWWWNVQRGKRCMAFWGTAAAQRIRLGPQVTVAQLMPADAAAEYAGKPGHVLVLGTEWQLVNEKDISKAPGLIHARNSLLEDASFAWEKNPADPPRFGYLVRFAEGEQTTTAICDVQSGVLVHLETARTAVLTPFTAKAWRRVLERHLGENATPQSK
jgi:hypothetical protein